MIVIDASSLAKYILREENWKEVRKHLENEDVFSLNLALVEISNAVWKHYALHKKISWKTAKTIFEAIKILKDVVFFEPIERYLEEAMKISVERKIPIYDSLYISQAIDYGKIITSDKLQAKIANRMGIKVEYVE
ncbi:MAG: type II toxin-antitoxin system VapC family toxin [Thermoplasmata archaeon]|nr:type II toxin-antitoxin system VapC family toxin [Thermoplasmata archaeon]